MMIRLFKVEYPTHSYSTVYELDREDAMRSINAGWSHRGNWGEFKPFNSELLDGTDVRILDLGHDGSERFFAVVNMSK